MATTKMTSILAAGTLLLSGVIVWRLHDMFSNIKDEPRAMFYQDLKGIDDSFELDIFRQLATAAKTGSNVVISPFSIRALLVMAAYGARDGTRSQLNELLFQRTDISDAQLSERYLQMRRDGVESNQKVLSVANLMYYNGNDFQVDHKYKDAIDGVFSGSLKNLNFKDPKSVDVVNGDVSEATRGKIDRLFDEIDPDTAWILVNAIYFKGNWEHEFEEQHTRKAPFYQMDGYGKQGQVDLMYRQIYSGYYYDSDLKAAAMKLPYRDSNTFMVVILPDKESAESMPLFNRKVTKEKLKHLIDNFSGYWSIDINLYLPRFKIESTHDRLKETITGMGADLMFGRNASFDGVGKGSRPIYVSKVIQKATIEVNEKGTEASAASGMMAVPMSLRREVTFRADRPFMYAIVSHEADKEPLVLFAGNFVKP